MENYTPIRSYRILILLILSQRVTDANKFPNIIIHKAIQIVMMKGYAILNLEVI